MNNTVKKMLFKAGKIKARFNRNFLDFKKLFYNTGFTSLIECFIVHTLLSVKYLLSLTSLNLKDCFDFQEKKNQVSP